MKYHDGVRTVEAWTVEELLDDWSFSAGFVMPKRIKEGIKEGCLEFHTLYIVVNIPKIGTVKGSLGAVLVLHDTGVFTMIPKKDFDEIYIPLKEERYIP